MFLRFLLLLLSSFIITPQGEADGTWWMPFSALVAEFDELAVCRMMVGFQQHRVVGEWKGDTAGGAHNPQLCPQFHLEVQEENCHVVVELRFVSKKKKKKREEKNKKKREREKGGAQVGW
jgi:hypothetical protein